MQKRHADLKEEFYARIRTETHQTPEVERRLRGRPPEGGHLRDSRATEAASRRRTEQMALAAAVLLLRTPEGPDRLLPDNIIPLRPSSD
ncbi:hypothetical protein Sfulv_50430 [Streptomyces fulvorobeus]|uniref:Uncharacterized protein n=1 Tax=Streptomyces fulvorobeus TaxID=284028 RepID=A0A7J0CCL3_9ACTN|nr:hypothetical protein [Streptomyces fulvorobeus]GFN00233.1 hypothetical protein Sfulv_50430 [Streptomyces fulvorobeus]